MAVKILLIHCYIWIENLTLTPELDFKGKAVFQHSLLMLKTSVINLLMVYFNSIIPNGLLLVNKISFSKDAEVTMVIIIII